MNVVQPSSSSSTTPLLVSSNIHPVISNNNYNGTNSTTNTSQSNGVIINFYTEVPSFELSLDDLEVYALSRIKVLRTIEQKRNLRNVDQQTLNKCIETKLKEQDLYSNQHKDVASHYIVRLSYCRTEELRNWLCRYECELFRYRLNDVFRSSHTNTNNSQFARTLVKQYANIVPITNKVKEQIRTSLLSCMSSKEYNDHIYSVPFEQVLNLVSNRTCFIQNGYVYVPETKIVDILVTKFRMNLSKELAIMGQIHNQRNAYKYDCGSSETDRIYPIINNLDKVLTETEPEYDPDSNNTIFGNGTERIVTASTVPQLVDHMPLCMRVLHKGMVQDKKLKYHGRLQYALFLKGAGLSMDDSIQFFQRFFTAISTEEFTKQHAYTIRHLYGKEGKRLNKNPYNCSKIIVGIQAPASGGQHHGCPYKHYDDEHLVQLLRQFNIGGTGSNGTIERKEILRYKQQHQYQLACLKHYEIQHPGATTNTKGINLENVGNHPNAWFRASLEYKFATAMTTSTIQNGPTTTTKSSMTSTTATPKGDKGQGGIVTPFGMDTNSSSNSNNSGGSHNNGIGNNIKRQQQNTFAIEDVVGGPNGMDISP